MKFATILVDTQPFVAVIDDTVHTARRVHGQDGRFLSDMIQLIANYNTLSESLSFEDEPLHFSKLRFAGPIPRPRRNIMCVGKNYHDHAHEFTRSGFDSGASAAADAVPRAPIIFTKMPETVIGDGDAVRYPTELSAQVDYEAELAVVIGVGGRNIRRSHADAHIFGYTILNDMTARDLQTKHKQWFLSKSLDGFCPMGPWIVTADEVDGSNLAIKCWVNDELRQSANTRDLIFDIPTLIETISAGLTLRPGDVIATGTPAGVGIGFCPPRFLSPGDVVKIEIEGLGRLTNAIV